MNPEWLHTQEFPFKSRFVEIDCHLIHYVDEGSGSTLLLLHGNSTWSFLYREIIKGLRDDFRCVAVDYPGFRLSQAASGYGFTPQEHSLIIEQLVQKLDLRKITLFCHDWGCPIGLGLAGRQPERFRGFVIGNTFAWSVNGNLKLEAFSRLLGGAMGGFLIRNFNAFVNLILPLGMQHPPHRTVMQHYRRPFSTRASREVNRIFAWEILGSRPFLEQVHQGVSQLAHKPTLILWGARNPAFTRQQCLRFEQLFPNSQTVILPNAGHFIAEDAPAQIVEQFRFWWQVKG
ncbi:MAG: alpha/beta hydrolase [Cyanobacteria bacterium SW_6_48_11]|jgi:haloalkane dehalogenase|nr:MAG: alpha/beta hydrolase [Cyanobacteria bacterium SW_6_48_11]PSP07376.1 MAG: alpha/beta hydrolase [Cyanobacteria bacterium SW_12_48_29]PSP13989.1 MAG: alpha/beta hydrolase [Cyanobacteria bacterium SW_10_48_33]PSP22713.1 MAG: alpha/beta hydrolase [Cyanobacteria bacterium SW_5_48_44]